MIREKLLNLNLIDVERIEKEAFDQLIISAVESQNELLVHLNDNQEFAKLFNLHKNFIFTFPAYNFKVINAVNYNSQEILKEEFDFDDYDIETSRLLF